MYRVRWDAVRFLGWPLLILTLSVASMGQRCASPSEPSPCAVTLPAPGTYTLEDVDRAYENGAASVECPVYVEVEPCPTCDVTINDVGVETALRREICYDVEVHIFSRGESLPGKDQLWRELRGVMECGR